MFDWLKEELASLKNRNPKKFFCLITLLILIIIIWSYIIFFIELSDKEKTFAENQIKDNSNFASGQRSDKIDNRENEINKPKDKGYYIRKTPFQKATINKSADRNDELLFSYKKNDVANNEKEKSKLEFNLEKEATEKASLFIQPLGILSSNNDKLVVIKRSDGNLHYRIGDEIEGYLIEAIKKEQIVVKNSRERLSFKLEKEL